MELALSQQFAVVFSITSFLMFLTYLPNNKHIPGVKHWAGALLLFPITYLLITQAKSVDDSWLFIVVNALLATALALIAIGIRLFYGVKQHNWHIWVYLMVSSLSVSSYFTFYSPDTAMRQVLLSLLALSCFLIMIFSLVSEKHQRSTAKTVLFSLCVFLSLTLLARIFFKLNFADSQTIRQSSVINMIELIMLSTSVFFAFSFSLLCQERYSQFRQANAHKRHNDYALKSLYMNIVYAQVIQPLGLNSDNAESSKQEFMLSPNKKFDKFNQFIRELFQPSMESNALSQLDDTLCYTPLESWLNQLVANLRPLANEKHISLTLTFPDPVGDCYLLEKEKLNLVINSLLTRLIELKDSGNIDITIQITPSNSPRHGASITFDFSDTCQTKNERSDASSEKTINEQYSIQYAKKVIETLGSELSFYMVNDQSYHFSFTLEASEGQAQDIRYQIPRYRITPVTHLALLLVSHCRHTSKQVKSALLEHQHHVDQTNSIEHLNQQLKTTNYDAIIIDINASNFNALTLPNIIRNGNNKWRSTPIIAITSNVSERAKAELEREGLTIVVAKPLNSQSLQRAINALIKPQGKTTTVPLQENKQSKKPLAQQEKSANAVDMIQALTQVNASAEGKTKHEASPTNELPRYIQQRKDQKQQAPVISESSNSPLFTANAIPLLARKTGEQTLTQTIKSINKELIDSLAHLKKHLAAKDSILIKQSIYQLALSCDKLGYIVLAEELLTVNVNDVQQNQAKHLKRFEALLRQSQKLLAEHLKTIS